MGLFHGMHILARRQVGVVLLSVGLCGVSVAGLEQRLAKALGSKQDPSEYAIQVVEPNSGTVIYSHNAHAPFMPASNMKLVTTAAALKYLGADFDYKTRVGLQNGALVVLGSGDPLLGDKLIDARHERPNGWIFEKIVQALREQNVAEVSDILVDTTVFDDERVHPSWPAKDHNRAFACEVCGLNFNGNCIEITATNQGGHIAVTVEPKTSFVEFINGIEPVTEGDTAIGAIRTQQPNKIRLYGKCRNKDGPVHIAIEQPAAFFGFVLAENLGRAGIGAKGRLIEKAVPVNAAFKPLVEFTTPLTDCLRRANTDSFNLVAEALIKTIDAQSKPDHKNGGWAGGRELIAKYLSDLGIAPEEFVIDDGCGLSRQDRLTTYLLTKVLLDLYHGKNWQMFFSSLAVGGEDGTIDKYFNEAKYRGRIHAKTGYISGVRALSGVCLTNSGPYIFSILSNGPKGLSRDGLNSIPKAIIDEYASRN
jgi:serine-type D-Ala-D-Ala carboxypeptidase/endopeptidase (penicillin-binding protein 4)